MQHKNTHKPRMPGRSLLLAGLLILALLAGGLSLPARAESEVHLMDDLTSVTITGASEKDGVYQIEAGKDIGMDLNYTIPAKTLPDDGTVVDQLPPGFTYSEVTDAPLYNDLGEQIGTYSISPEGQVTTVYNQTAIQENQDGGEIIGSLSVTAKADESTWPSGTTKTLDFGPNITIPATLYYPPDISVNKSATIGPDGQTIYYTVTITSKGGTDGQAVTLTDTLSGGFEIGNVTVVNQDGQSVDFSYNQIDAMLNGELDGTLPAMSAGETYTITYQIIVDPFLIGQDGVSNTATATAGSLSSTASTTVTFGTMPEITKSGTVNSDDKTVSWSADINPNGNDLGGWTLSDTFTGGTMPETVTISPAVDGQTQITLPYTFPAGASANYQITYTTSAQVTPGTMGLSNQMTLTSPFGQTVNSNTVQLEWSTDGVVYEPLTKGANVFGSLVYHPANNTTTLSWGITITAYQSIIDAPWTITEDPGDGQYFTKSQIEDVIRQFTEAGYPPTATTTPASPDGLQDGVDYSGYQLTFDRAIPKGDSVGNPYVGITVESTMNGPAEDGVSYSNTAKLDDQSSTATIAGDNGQIRVDKVDASDVTGGPSTSHTYTTGEAAGPSWAFEVDIPDEGSHQAITITDTIPEGLSLDTAGLEVVSQTDSSIRAGFTFDGDSGSATFQDEPIEATIDGSNITFTIPETSVEALAGENIEIILPTDIDDLSDWPVDDDGTASETFTNTGTVTIDGKSESVSQTQTISVDMTTDLLNKAAEAAGDDGKYPDNIIPYSIDVNPNAIEAGNGKELILDDVLTYTQSEDSGPVSVTLVPDSVEVFDVGSDGTLTELADSDYTYTSTKSVSGDTTQLKLRLTLPDEHHLLVKYRYLVTGDVDDLVSIDNAVVLENSRYKTPTSSAKTNITIGQDTQSSTVYGLTVLKTDADDSAHMLTGAVFEVEVYNAATGDFVPYTSEGQTLTWTTQSGSVIIPAPENTLFRLKEIQAPTGYELPSDPMVDGVFYLDTTDESVAEIRASLPAAYADSAEIFRYNGSIQVANDKKTTDRLEVQKNFTTASGENVAPAVSSIDVDVYRSEGGGAPMLYTTLTLDADNDWQASIEVPDDDAVYSVEEKIVPSGYQAVYDANTDHAFVITNIEQARVTLPATGSGGMTLMILAGLTGFGIIALLKHRGK